MVLPNAILLVLPRGLGSHRLWSRTSKLMSHGTCHFPLGPTSPNPWQLPQREPHRRLPHSPSQFTVHSSRASAEPLDLGFAHSCRELLAFTLLLESDDLQHPHHSHSTNAVTSGSSSRSWQGTIPSDGACQGFSLRMLQQ